MKINLHNKIELFNGKNKYVFYNKMFESIYDALEKFESYNEYIAVGIGVENQNEKTQKLSKFIKKYGLTDEFVQNDITKGSLFIEKSFVIDEMELADSYITEIGLCENKENDPNIYNYITLISNETPNGIKKNYGEKWYVKITIYLKLSAESEGLLCAGENKLISFLLGSGLNDQIYAYRGQNLTDNVLIERGFFESLDKKETMISIERNNGLCFKFEADLDSGETDEIVFALGQNIVARINVMNYKNASLLTENFISTENKVLNLGGNNIKSVNEVFNLNGNIKENNYQFFKYANSFGDEILVPFLKNFNYDTARFVSKDGNMIFFVKNDYIYGFRNENYQIKEIVTGNLFLQDIRKIVSFDNFVFVLLKYKPFVQCFCIVDNVFKKVELNSLGFEYYNDLENAINVDITMTKNDKIILASIFQDGKGVSAYFDYDEMNKRLNYDSCLVSNYDFSYLVAMYKNNYSDAAIIFIKEAEYSYECRMVTHYADKTYRDVATVLAYDLCHNTKEIYAKGRAVIVEKITSPKVFIYYYPELENYNLSLIQNEEDDYFSSDLYYLIQKYDGNQYKVYNLVEYNKLVEYENQLEDFVDVSKILGFEFLNDTLLIFMNDEENLIRALNLKKNYGLIENVSSALEGYQVTYEKYNKVGLNNEGVKASLILVVSI